MISFRAQFKYVGVIKTVILWRERERRSKAGKKQQETYVHANSKRWEQIHRNACSVDKRSHNTTQTHSVPILK